MIKLIKNELFKIFHKKGIYIVFGVSIVVTGLLTWLNNMDLRIMSYNMNVENYESMIKEYETENIEIDEHYVDSKAWLESLKIIEKKDKNMTYYSPEYHFILNQIQPLYVSYFSNIYLYNEPETAELLKQKIDQKVLDLNNFDWKKQINEELEEAKHNECDNDETCKKVTNEQIYLLNYRLENNIPYTFKDSSKFIDDYLTKYTSYLTLEKDESKIKTRNELLQKREIENSVQTSKYKLDNKLIQDDYKNSDAQIEFIDSISTVSIFVVVCIVLVSSSVIADEFNKGTIKQLLVKPFTRSKIVVSKIIAILLTIMLFVLLVSIGQSIVLGILNGTLKTIFDPVVMYSYNSHSVISTNTLFAGLLKFACILPEIIILVLITVLISVLFTNNGVSTALGIVTYAAAGILGMYVDAKPVISYLPFVNWDLNVYLFGGIPDSKYLVLSKAIYICVSTTILLLIGILLFFKHKDIKNQ